MSSTLIHYMSTFYEIPHGRTVLVRASMAAMKHHD